MKFTLEEWKQHFISNIKQAKDLAHLISTLQQGAKEAESIEELK